MTNITTPAAKNTARLHAGAVRQDVSAPHGAAESGVVVGCGVALVVVVGASEAVVVGIT